MQLEAIQFQHCPKVGLSASEQGCCRYRIWLAVTALSGRTSDSLTHGSDCFQLSCPSQPNSDFRLHFCWMDTDGMCRHAILLYEHDIYFQPRDTEGNTRTLLPKTSKVSSTELLPRYNESGLIPAVVQFKFQFKQATATKL